MTVVTDMHLADLLIVDEQSLEFDVQHWWCWVAMLRGLHVGNLELPEGVLGACVISLKTSNRLKSGAVHYSKEFCDQHKTVMKYIQKASPKWKVISSPTKQKKL